MVIVKGIAQTYTTKPIYSWKKQTSGSFNIPITTVTNILVMYQSRHITTYRANALQHLRAYLQPAAPDLSCLRGALPMAAITRWHHHTVFQAFFPVCEQVCILWQTYWLHSCRLHFCFAFSCVKSRNSLFSALFSEGHQSFHQKLLPASEVL